MIKSQKNSIITSAINATMFLIGLLLLITSLNTCATPPPPPWYKSYGFNSNEEVIRASSVPNLINALSDNDEDVRIAAAEALGKIGPEAKGAVPALIIVLGDSDHVMRNRTVEALGKIGPEAKEAIPAHPAGKSQFT